MKRYIILFLVCKLYAKETLIFPSFDSVQLTSAEQSAGKGCGCDGTGRVCTVTHSGGFFGSSTTERFKDRRADSLLFLRNKKYIDVLSDFVDMIKGKVDKAVAEINQLVVDSTFRSERIVGLQKGILDTIDLIDTLKKSISGVFENITKGLSQETEKLVAQPNVEKNDTTTSPTFLSIMQEQLKQVDMITQAMKDGVVFIENRLKQLNEKPAQMQPKEKPAQMQPKEKPAQMQPKEKSAQMQPKEKPAQMQPKKKSTQQSMIELQLQRGERQLIADQKALSGLQDMLNNVDSKVLAQQVDKINSYVSDIQDSAASITYHEQIFKNDQATIKALEDTINTVYIPKLNQSKKNIDQKAKWLQSKVSDKEMFKNCRKFFQKTL